MVISVIELQSPVQVPEGIGFRGILCADPVPQFLYFLFTHSAAVIRHDHMDLLVIIAVPDRHNASLGHILHAMLEGILHNGLYDQRRDPLLCDLVRQWLCVNGDTGREADTLDLQIIHHMTDLVLQGYDLLRHFRDIPVVLAQVQAEIRDILVPVCLSHAVHQVQRIEQKVRIDLKLQLLQLCLLRPDLFLIDL